MSDERIRALDTDLEQSRNAFLHAREAQRRLSLNTHDVNRTGANESRPDSITPGVIHTHDVIRLGANESQPDSIITHDVNSNTHDVNRSGAQSRLDSNTHDVNRPEAQSRLNSNTHDATPDLRKDAPHASERTRQDLPGSPMTVVDPELPRPGDHAQGTAHAPRGRVPPSPTTLLIEQAEQGVREAVEGIPGEGILTPLTPFTERQKQQHREAVAAAKAMWGMCAESEAAAYTPRAGPRTTCTPELLPHHKMPHPPVTPLLQESGQPLPPSSDQPMGGGLADHEPAAAGTGGSEFSHVSENAVGEAASSHTSPSTTCTPDLVSLHKMSHPPATPPSQDCGQLLSPSTHNTMGDGLVDHEPAVAEVGGSESSHTSEDEIEKFEPRDVSHPPANPPSQESDQLLPPSSYNTMGGGLAEHEPAVAATGGSEFRDASKDASKDESETLTSSQKKRIKRKESKAKRVAEEKAPKAMCGVHTRFREMKPCDDEDSDISIEDFSAEGDSLNYCASPSSSFS